MSIQDIINIFSLTFIAITVFVVLMSIHYQKQKRTGKMNLKTRLGFNAGEFVFELRGKYEKWQLGSIESIKSVDEYIDEKLQVYSSSDLVKDENLIFKIGAFVGEIMKLKRGYSWKYNKDEEPYLQKKWDIILPFELVRNRIKNMSGRRIYEELKEK